MSTWNISLFRPYTTITEQSDRRIEALIQSVSERLRLYREYRRGIAEMSACSDRVLHDLGIFRCDIRRLAYESTYQIKA